MTRSNINNLRTVQRMPKQFLVGGPRQPHRRAKTASPKSSQAGSAVAPSISEKYINLRLSQGPNGAHQGSGQGYIHDGALERTLAALPAAFGKAVHDANKPMRDILLLAQDVVKEKQLTRAQKFADVIHHWALPLVQVLLGAAVLALGISIMEVSITVLGATMCATGLAICATLLAGMMAPHPLDRVKKFLARRQPRDPEMYEPGMVVALDAG